MKILITRPAEQAVVLADKLAAHHITPIIFSAIEIIDPPQPELLSSIFDDLNKFDAVVFVSPSAVIKAGAYIKNKPEKLMLLATGSGTADAIEKQGWGKAIFPKEQFNSEALLALPELQQLQHKQLLLCRGVGGQADAMAKILRDRGATVTEAILYQRALPQESLPDLSSIEVIVVTSGEALSNLIELSGSQKSLLQQKALLVSSDKLKHMAEQLGFTQPIRLASNASDEAILHALLTLKDDSTMEKVGSKQPWLLLSLLSLIVIMLFAAIGWVWQQQKLLETKSVVFQSSAQQQLAALVQESNQQKDVLKKMSAQDVNHWKLAEIVYFIQLAQTQLQINHSATNALLLLQQAQKQTAELANPKLINFRNQLGVAITTLENVPVIDTNNILEQINQLRDLAPKLAILVPPTAEVPALAHGDAVHQKWWQRAWGNIKTSFSALVIVRHQDELMPALMSPAQQLYLQQNLEISLMQAQWAVLNHQQYVYQQSLQQAATLAQKFYVQSSASTQEFLKQLQGLEKITVAPALPDLTVILNSISSEAA